VIVVPAAPLAPADAAGRASAGVGPFWLASPGPKGDGDGDGDRGGDADIDITADFVACDPVRVVEGSSVEQLQQAWAEQRRRWSDDAGAPPPVRVPIGVGWLSYDLARQWIRLRPQASDDHGWPDIGFYFYDAVWCRHSGGQTASIAAVDQAAARRLSARLATSVDNASSSAAAVHLPALRADQTDDRYLAGVARILDYLQAGDAYQVNLARRLAAPFDAVQALALADGLRARAPAPHSLWMTTADGRAAIVGNSPERFLRVDGAGAIETRPIKGTARRGADAKADRAARQALLASEKDRAEHVMIVDLERNDLGRVCVPGSLVLEGLARVVALPTVFHLVSTVRGRLRADVDLVALLRATFPGGSVTGAPKQRAMEIIEELEPFRRGPYTGATGWLGAAGDLDLAVAIRTALVRGGRLTLSVGGGIVADSLPAAELAETTAKAAAFADLADKLG
jgi:para-aminobenzoate synthetase component 1